MGHKPEGYTDLAPYLVVADPEAVLTFCAEAFGAERLRVVNRPDGSVMHAECRIGDTVLMMGGMVGGPPATLHLYLPDPDHHVARAVELGAVVIEPITDRDDGARRGGVRSPDGTTWYLACQG